MQILVCRRIFLRTKSAFADFEEYLISELLDAWQSVSPVREESILSDDIFKRLKDFSLIDSYKAYQILDDVWSGIAEDLEMMQTENGLSSVRQVDDNIVIKKKNDEDVEVMDGYKGHILPFDLVERVLLPKQHAEVLSKRQRLDEVEAELSSIIESFSEEELDGKYINDSNDGFAVGEFKKKMAEIYADVDSPEISLLKEYPAMLKKSPRKAEKEEYVNKTSEVNWSNVDKGSDGFPTKKAVLSYINQLQQQYPFPEDSFEAKMVHAEKLLAEESQIKTEVKILSDTLIEETKRTIESLSDADAVDMLRHKWILPLCSALEELPKASLSELVKALDVLSKKYAVTFVDVEDEISASEQALSAMIDELTGNEYDMKGLQEFKRLINGKGN